MKNISLSLQKLRQYNKNPTKYQIKKSTQQLIQTNQNIKRTPQNPQKYSLLKRITLKIQFFKK